MVTPTAPNRSCLQFHREQWQSCINHFNIRTEGADYAKLREGYCVGRLPYSLPLKFVTAWKSPQGCRRSNAFVLYSAQCCGQNIITDTFVSDAVVECQEAPSCLPVLSLAGIITSIVIFVTVLAGCTLCCLGCLRRQKRRLDAMRLAAARRRLEAGTELSVRPMLRMPYWGIGKDRLPKPTLQERIQGDWSKGTITGMVLTWSHDGSETTLAEASASSVQLSYEGQTYIAHVTADGRLQWNDGDVWYRIEALEAGAASQALRLSKLAAPDRKPTEVPLLQDEGEGVPGGTEGPEAARHSTIESPRARIATEREPDNEVVIPSGVESSGVGAISREVSGTISVAIPTDEELSQMAGAAQLQAPEQSTFTSSEWASFPPPSPREEVITGETLEEEVTLWLERLSGESREEREFGEWLHDGQVLCKAANAVEPGIVKKINAQKMPFKQMENVSNFIGACRKLGVLEKDLFSTVDLYEEKNIKGVQLCIYNFASIIRTTAKSFNGPYLGVQQKAVVKDDKRAAQQPTLATGLRVDVAHEVRGAVKKGRILGERDRSPSRVD